MGDNFEGLMLSEFHSFWRLFVRVQFAHRSHSGYDCGVGLAICGGEGEWIYEIKSFCHSRILKPTRSITCVAFATFFVEWTKGK